MDKDLYLDSRTLTDWHGKVLRPEARDLVGVGNIVRVVVKHPNLYAEAIYLRIVEVVGDNLKGVVLSTYRSQEEYVKDGEIIEFKRKHITEIPDGDGFPENNNLGLDEYRTKESLMTGV